MFYLLYYDNCNNESILNGKKSIYIFTCFVYEILIYYNKYSIWMHFFVVDPKYLREKNAQDSLSF